MPNEPDNGQETTRAFPTPNVLGTVCRCVPPHSSLQGMRALVGFMFGRELSPNEHHERWKIAGNLLRDADPHLDKIEKDINRVGDFHKWEARWIAKLGPTVEIPRFPEPAMPPTPRCIGCGKSPAELEEYTEAVHGRPFLSADDYVRREEGTYNPLNGHFACTPCYCAIGMPTAPGGWVAP